MAGLTDQAGGPPNKIEGRPKKAQQIWEDSMLRSIDRLREEIKTGSPHLVADRSGALFKDGRFNLPYWGQALSVTWPDLKVLNTQNEPCSTFDTAMIIYYLFTADGAPFADRWISFRELPDGGFYNQAFQGYTGNRLARSFGDRPQAFDRAANTLDGWRLSGLSQHAFAFQPLPRVQMACALWPGDEDFPAKASVLFDASASHYLPTDGLALLGSGLTGRLIKGSPQA